MLLIQNEQFLSQVMPSNVKYLENLNKTGNYTTKLASKLLLDGEWEVAISSIIYPKSWYNIKTDQRIAIVQSNGTIYDQEEVDKAGNYENEQELINFVNKQLYDTIGKHNKSNLLNVPFLEYNKYSRMVTIQYGSIRYSDIILYPLWQDELLESFGFDLSYREMFEYKVNRKKRAVPIRLVLTPEKREANEKIYKPVLSFGLTAGATVLFVYTDILKASLVGDSHAQLLRVIPVPNARFRDILKENYSNPYYFPVISNEIQTMEIDIKDQTEETVKFTEGIVTVVLHIRKKNELF